MSSDAKIDKMAGSEPKFGLTRRHLLAGATTALALSWASKARAADKLTLRLDYTASGLHAPFYRGMKHGWFEKAGVDLYMEDGNGSSATIKLVGAGSFDVGLHSLGPLAVARAMKVPVISVAGFVRKGELGFLVPAESGWKTPKDLIGKKIAYGVASQEGPFVRYFFQQNGVQEQSDFSVQGQVSQTIAREETVLRAAATEIGRAIVALAVTRF